MRLLERLVASGLFACLPVSAYAQTAETPCGQFDLFIEYQSADAVTASDDKVSLGDTRHALASLLNAEGDEVAKFIIFSTVVAGGTAGRHNMMLNGQLLFMDGTLAVSGLYDRSDIAGSQSDAAPEFDLALHAGTGDFAGYNGAVRLSRDKDNRRVYSFDFPCN